MLIFGYEILIEWSLQMKNLIKSTIAFFLMTLTLLNLAFADTTVTPSLKDNMKQTNIALKAIVASVNDASKNADNATLLDKMILNFQAARLQSPDSTANGSFADYQSLIDQEIQNFKDLKDAFLKNDNTTALAIIQKITTTKQEGHDKYK